MLTQTEVSAYLDLLGVDAPAACTKEALDKLVLQHQLRVPFNTSVIVRNKRIPATDVATLFDKIVTRKLGGYCFELNKLFEVLLTSLGFDARCALARVLHGSDQREPINHRAVIVRIEGVDHLVDVGLGGPMAAGAVALREGCDQVFLGAPFMARPMDESWWAIERITRAKADFFDDDIPEQRQLVMELCTVKVEDRDFNALNVVLSAYDEYFRDHEYVNLRTENGHRSITDGKLTIKVGAEKDVSYLQTPDEVERALETWFGMTGVSDYARTCSLES